MAHVQVIQFQTDFRGRVDTVAEGDDAGWFASTNTNWSVPSGSSFNDKFRVRFGLVANSIVGAIDATYTLSYSHNNGSFIQVTTTSSVIQSATSTYPGYDDDDEASQLITNYPGFVTPNALINEGDNETGEVRWSDLVGDPLSCESEWVLQFVAADLNEWDTVELRLRVPQNAPLSGGYTHSPVILIKGPQIKIKGKELKIKGKEVRI